MAHGLGGEIVQEVGVVVVGNVVEVHQAAHDVILEARFLDAAAPKGHDFKLVRAQVLDP